MGLNRCTPVALGFKGSEWGSKLGTVANNGENTPVAFVFDEVKALAMFDVWLVK